MNGNWIRALVRTVAFLGALACAGGSQAAELPPGKQVVFLARVIAYDGNLKARAGEAVNIGIVVKKGDSGSETMAAGLEKAFSSLGTSTILGLPLKVSHIHFTGRDALDSNLADIKSVARTRKVMTVGSSESHVRLGISLGVFIVDGKNVILVNLEASREEGISFGPEFLRLATVVR
jgi:hypothetical protein